MSHITLILETFRKRTNSFTRFLLVGVLNTLTGISVMFMLLNFLGFSYWVSTFIGNSIGALLSYILNRTFTFQSQVNIKTGALRFFIVILLCYFISYSLSELIAERIYHLNITLLVINKNEIAILLGSGFYTLSNYFGQKYLVFKK